MHNLMSCRWSALNNVYNALVYIGVPFIEYDFQTVKPLTVGDDIGMYLFIPKLALFFDMSLENAVVLFFSILLWLPLTFSFIGFWLSYNRLISRFIIVVNFVLFAYTLYRITDVYLAYSASALFCVPWVPLLYKQYKGTFVWIYYFLMGFLAVFFHVIRAYASLPMLGFVSAFNAILFAKHAQYRRTQLYLMSTLMLGALFLGSYIYKQQLYFNNFILKKGLTEKVTKLQHPKWHTIFLGFGFLQPSNPLKIQYADDWAFEYVKKKKPHIRLYSQEYEQELKNETLSLIWNYPVFVLFTIFSKIGILLFYFLLFAHIGVACALLNNHCISINVSFIVALLLSMIFPLISLPTIRVLSLSFITFSWLFGLFNMLEWLEPAHS